MAVTDIFSQLRRDEGTSLRLYTDTVGKVSIGTGRNLSDDGISQPEADQMLANDVKKAISAVHSAFPWTTSLDDVRFGVLTNMAFNMGVGGLAGFRMFLGALEQGDYQTAAKDMLDSVWAKQVGDRAERLALQITSGQWQ